MVSAKHRVSTVFLRVPSPEVSFLFQETTEKRPEAPAQRLSPRKKPHPTINNPQPVIYIRTARANRIRTWRAAAKSVPEKVTVITSPRRYAGHTETNNIGWVWCARCYVNVHVAVAWSSDELGSGDGGDDEWTGRTSRRRRLIGHLFCGLDEGFCDLLGVGFESPGKWFTGVP